VVACESALDVLGALSEFDCRNTSMILFCSLPSTAADADVDVLHVSSPACQADDEE